MSAPSNRQRGKVRAPSAVWRCGGARANGTSTESNASAERGKIEQFKKRGSCGIIQGRVDLADGSFANWIDSFINSFILIVLKF